MLYSFLIGIAGQTTPLYDGQTVTDYLKGLRHLDIIGEFFASVSLYDEKYLLEEEKKLKKKLKIDLPKDLRDLISSKIPFLDEEAYRKELEAMGKSEEAIEDHIEIEKGSPPEYSPMFWVSEVKNEEKLKEHIEQLKSEYDLESRLF